MKFRAPGALRGRVVPLFGDRRPEGPAIAFRAPAALRAAPAYPEKGSSHDLSKIAR
jgi:hypothetical protein